jgi:hypothetical protein
VGRTTGPGARRHPWPRSRPGAAPSRSGSPSGRSVSEPSTSFTCGMRAMISAGAGLLVRDGLQARPAWPRGVRARWRQHAGQRGEDHVDANVPTGISSSVTPWLASACCSANPKNTPITTPRSAPMIEMMTDSHGSSA